MKILLDESCPRKLRNDFGPEHEVWTVRDKGWLGQKNGSLLALLVTDGFELFITVDRNLLYQQSIERLQVPIFVLCAPNNKKDTLALLLPKVFQLLESEVELSNITEIW